MIALFADLILLPYVSPALVSVSVMPHGWDSFVALVATVGVYGIVAMLVRIDDLGFRLITLSKNERGFSLTMGKLLVKSLPKIIKTLGVIGTVAMLLVAGGIYVHNIEALHNLLNNIRSMVAEFFVGLLIGIIILDAVKLILYICSNN